MNVLTKISELNNLTSNEENLAKFILEHPEVVINSRANEIARLSFSSTSTLYRFINKLGLSGLAEFKIELISSLKMIADTKELNYDYPISKNDTSLEMMQSLYKLYQGTIDDTFMYMDSEAIEEVVERLYTAKVIDVYSTSANLFFAKNFKFQMQEIGVLVNVPDEDYIQSLSAANSDQTHIAIVVSFGGRGVVISNVTQMLYEQGIDIVLITSTQDNPLTKYAKYKLYLASSENHYNKISSFSTRLSLLYVFDMLYSFYFHKDYERNILYKLNNYKKINKELK